MNKRPPYDVMREMADAVTYRGMIVWIGILLLLSAFVVGAIALKIANNHLYVHRDVAHPITLPVHWR